MFFLIFFVVSIILIPQVKITKNLSKYLADEAESKQGLEILEAEFPHLSLENHAKILVTRQNINEIIEIKKQIQNIQGVNQVIWLDDFVDLENVPIEYIPDEVKINYYRDNKALFDVVFEKDVNTRATKKAMEEINTILNDIGGVGLEERSVVEIGTIAVIIAFAVLILIIFLFTESFMQALLMIIILCLAIVFNLGTNIIFGDISNITLMAASVIQLAVSIDYTLIFFKNFRIVRENNDDINTTISEATSRSFKTIFASALTTIAGFLALSVMNYKIGIELGIVLAKGVTFSLITVLVLLPILVKIFIKSIDKTKHKPLLPSINFLSKIIHGKVSYIVLTILAILIFFGFLGQMNNEYLYSENHIEYHQIEKEIVESFGEFNDLILIVPNNQQVKELSLVGELNYLDNLKAIKNIYLLPEQIPDSEKMMFVSQNYSLIYLTFNLEKESDETFKMIEKIRDLTDKYYEESYLVGKSAIIYDTKTIIESDYLLVIIVSIISILLIILLSFKSIAIPLLLILIIQTAIWVNMAVPYFQGTKISFLGYILISSIQLGATIDYAIIMTENYERERLTKGKVEAAKSAFVLSNQAILVSMLALIIAGISLTLMIDMDLVKDLGILISRGTFISGVLSLLFLPPLLILFDKVIDKTTVNRKALK